MVPLVAALLAWIRMTAGYEIPETRPEIRFVSNQYIVDTLCDGKECGAVAMYLREDTIYLDERLDVLHDFRHRSVLLHELVHWVQTRSGKFPGRDCETWLAQEREAYALQARWLGDRRAFFLSKIQFLPRDFCERVRARETAAVPTAN